jgi:hypothetical protein
VGDVSSTSAVTKCPVNNVADTTPPSVPATPGTSPGISGQTSPPASVIPATGQKVVSSDELECIARNAVDAFLREKSTPAGDGQHNARVNALKNAAIYATEANLQRQEQLISPNREKISGARRLARQALETKQGQAETAESFAWDKYKEVFALKRTYEARLKDRQGEPPTDWETKTVAVAIQEAKQAAETNLRAWVQADNLCSISNPEPHGDHPRQCATRRASAEETVELVSLSAKDANKFIAALDQRAAQRAAGKH